MEIDSNPTDSSSHSDPGYRGRFGPSHSLPPLATNSYDPTRPPHSQAPGAHILEHSQPAHLPPIQSAASLSALPTVGSLQQLQDQKRSRACKSCRGLKVRCEPNTDDPSKQCKRCAKANRECIFMAPSRKRQKKADTKVAELEKKIDALTASLSATRQMAARESQGEDDNEEDCEDETPVDAVAEAALQSPLSARPSKRKRESDDSQAQQQLRNEAKEFSASCPFLAPEGSKIPVSTHIKPVEGNGHQYEYVDVIGRQLLSIEMAREIFDHYIENLVPHFPAVVFPPGTTADQVRREKPTLFLAILASASRMNHPDLHHALHKEISRALAEKIMINGAKSLEMVQALLVTGLWYYPPEHVHELKYYMLTHQAAAMAVEIGLGRKTVLSKSPGILSIPRAMPPGEHTGPREMPHGPWTPGPGETHPPPDNRKHRLSNPPPGCARVDSSTLESRRTLLACYWSCCTIAIASRRPTMLRFTPFMAECVQELETNPKAAKTDISLTNLVKMQRIAEDVGNEFAFDQVDAVVDLREERVQLKLREFNRRLEIWKDELPEKAQHPQLEMSFHLVSIYTNEIALHNNHNVDDFRPPFAESLLHPPASSQPLTSLHLDAIKTCMLSANAIVSTFLSLPLVSARSLPMFNFIRCHYIYIILMTIYFAAWSPKSELGKHIDGNSLEIAQSLERLISKLEEAASEDKCRGAKTFAMIMKLIKKCYLQRNAEIEQALGMPVEPGVSLSRLDLGDGESGTEAGGAPGSLSTSGDSAPTPLPNSNYSHSPCATMSGSRGAMPPGTALGDSNLDSPNGNKYFMGQRQQDSTQNPFLPLPPPQHAQPQHFDQTFATPGYTLADQWTAPLEQLVFSGNGEMIPDNGFWTSMGGHIGMGMLDWDS